MPAASLRFSYGQCLKCQKWELRLNSAASKVDETKGMLQAEKDRDNKCKNIIIIYQLDAIQLEGKMTDFDTCLNVIRDILNVCHIAKDIKNVITWIQSMQRYE